MNVMPYMQMNWSSHNKSETCSIPLELMMMIKKVFFAVYYLDAVKSWLFKIRYRSSTFEVAKIKIVNKKWNRNIFVYHWMSKRTRTHTHLYKQSRTKCLDNHKEMYGIDAAILTMNNIINRINIAYYTFMLNMYIWNGEREREREIHQPQQQQQQPSVKVNFF